MRDSTTANIYCTHVDALLCLAQSVRYNFQMFKVWFSSHLSVQEERHLISPKSHVYISNKGALSVGKLHLLVLD